MTSKQKQEIAQLSDQQQIRYRDLRAAGAPHAHAIAIVLGF